MTTTRRLDRVRIRISRPHEARTVGYKVPVIFEHSPYRGDFGPAENHAVDFQFLPHEFLGGEGGGATELERAATLRRTNERSARMGIRGATGPRADLRELPFNCEHVVPQSWFSKREPMRGDLHHLFACESRCNSFRGNWPYFDFDQRRRAVREDCGRLEAEGFQPSAGKGPVARAMLYFLLRDPRQVGDSERELTAARLELRLRWHETDPVSDYERHRNAAIHELQGNRNPLIDRPDWARELDFAAAWT